jgi:cyclophilin family peptidyl-prolyl cis-trans isomerase/HEAT repeat protein
MLPAIALVFVFVYAAPALAQEMSLRERMLLAEDARAQTAPQLEALRRGLAERDPRLRRQAVRAIGRLERPDLIASLTRALADDNGDVRSEAANAVGQMARGEKGVADATGRLLVRARSEDDPRVWGTVAATLGRLPYTTAADVDQVETVIAGALPSAAATAIQIDALLGAVEGLEALTRQSGKISRLKDPTIAGLRVAAVLEGRAQDAAKLARIRRFATLALTAAGAVTRPQLEAGVRDEDDEVRRLTMIAARAEIEGRDAVIATGLADSNARVRYEALQTWGRQLQKTSCDPIVTALRDRDPHVMLLAIDLLGNGCPGDSRAAAAVRAVAEVLTPQPGRWRGPAHALVALARLAPAEARIMLPRYASHGTWQVRMYAARAAAALAATDVLEQLGRDAHDNVREASLAELVALKRPEAIPLALEALTRPDYQLLITAARALGDSPDKERAAAALRATLARINAEKRDTARDVRLAILDTLGRLKPGAEPADRAIPPPLLDAGRRIALDQLDALAARRIRFTIAGRGAFELRLLVDEAPFTVLQVATLARTGYYNGLTFHRVVPNFVIQGGSPGANEYMGQGPFMRDEVGLVAHLRGTVGISTRGRDTGDAQIFVNLVDSPRLDHTYTVFAEVITGMEVVDAIVEGDVIERAEIVPPGP